MTFGISIGVTAIVFGLKGGTDLGRGRHGGITRIRDGRNLEAGVLMNI